MDFSIKSHSQLISSTPSSERWWVLGFAVVVMVITSLPYLFGFATEGDNWRFTGFVFGVEDGNSYIAKMMAGAAGDWLFRTPYTAFPQRGVIAFLPYILLGKLTSPTDQHLQLVVLYHLFRFGAGILATSATYDFLSIFIGDIRLRRFGLALAILGAGLGWILVLIGKPNWLDAIPLEFYSPESFGFLSLFGLPHLSMARALLLWGIVSYLRDEKFKKPSFKLPGLKTGILLLLLGFFQPLTVVVAWTVLAAHLAILAIWQIWKERIFEPLSWNAWLLFAREGIASFLISSPIVVYTYAKFRSDPFLKLWTAQNLITSPHPGHYLLAYGLLIPFAIGGARYLIKKIPHIGWLPIGWTVLLPFLAYAPYNLQRRLPEGVWVALVVLAIKGLEGWKAGRLEGSKKEVLPGTFAHLKEGRLRGWKKLISAKGQSLNFYPIALPLLLSFPSTVILLVGGLQAVEQSGLPVYRPMEEVRAFQFLAEYAHPKDVILTSYDTGNALPAWAPLRVVIGHGPESIALDDLRPKVKDFYSVSTPDGERRNLLEWANVRYVFWGPNEQALGKWNPANAGYLELVYDQDNYRIFERVYWSTSAAHPPPQLTE